MEARKIIIVESGGQKKKVIESGAETLGQLKADLRANNINYEGKTFFEGLSKTELTQDDSLLPRDIPRNGGTTNNLVFMLTVPQKKIKSGGMSRQEAYAKIKELGLQDTCVKKFGKNFTMCKTDDLISLINGAAQGTVATPKKEEKKEEPKPVVQQPMEETKKESKQSTPKKVEKATPEADAIRKLVDILYEEDVLDSEQADEILAVLGGGKVDGDMDNSPYTNSELDEILRGCHR